jgi:hypothetical protein
MGHYASEMGYTRYVAEWEQWGFKRISFASYNSVIECPVCHAAVVKGYGDGKEDSMWWAHVLWHRASGEEWPVQPPSNS